MILIDNQSIIIQQYSMRKISLVGQDTTLFDDTISNIAYANLDASQNEIIEQLNILIQKNLLKNY